MTTPPGAARSIPFDILVGITTLLILLQGLWAGIFMDKGDFRAGDQNIVDVHARSADIAIVLAIIATIIGVIKLRSRKDLWIGTGLLAVLLIAEAYIGGRIRDHNETDLTAVHVPLAMVILALAVYLPLRSRTGRDKALAVAAPEGRSQP